MSVANLCDIEKGRKGVSPEKAEQIAKAIGVPAELLIRLSIEESLRAAGSTIGCRFKARSITFSRLVERPRLPITSGERNQYLDRNSKDFARSGSRMCMLDGRHGPVAPT